jgi:hypothetical protein
MSDLPNNDQGHDKDAGQQAGNGCGCNTSDCCSSAPAGRSSPHRKLRTGLFAIIVLGAVAVAAYSLLLEPASADNVAGMKRDSLAQDAAVSAGMPSSDTGGLTAEGEFVFLVLAATEEGPGPRIETVVKQALQGIAGRGISAATRNLCPSDSGYEDMKTRYGVASLPAVVAMKKGGTARLVEGEIDEANLLKAYLACCSSSSCCSGGARTAGCNPSACGK